MSVCKSEGGRGQVLLEREKQGANLSPKIIPLTPQVSASIVKMRKNSILDFLIQLLCGFSFSCPETWSLGKQ